MKTLTKLQVTREIEALGLIIYDWKYRRELKRYEVSIVTGPKSIRTFEDKFKHSLLKSIKEWASKE